MITLEEFVEVCKRNSLTLSTCKSGTCDFTYRDDVVCRYKIKRSKTDSSEVFVWTEARLVDDCISCDAIYFYEACKPNTVEALQYYINKAMESYRSLVKKIRLKKIEEL